MLRPWKCRLAALLIGTSLAAGAAWAETITDPEKIGPYAAQGEYVGAIEVDDKSHKVGAQVIALGDDKFRLVVYGGGLPGDGWSRGEGKESCEGTREGDVIRFEKENRSAVLEGETLKLLVDDQELGTLKKTERKSPTLGAKPPEGAIVLFDGESADAFEDGRMTDDGLLWMGVTTKEKFGDMKLHLEFRLPLMPSARGQQRGNSGVYVDNRYEVQILDSFGLEGLHNECGGIYSMAQPKVNMCFPPLTWQTYDIDFTAARYDEEGNKTSNARITVRHNGVLIHDNVELLKETPGRWKEGPEPGPIYLQDHRDPVVFRNIWVVKKESEAENDD